VRSLFGSFRTRVDLRRRKASESGSKEMDSAKPERVLLVFNVPRTIGAGSFRGFPGWAAEPIRGKVNYSNVMALRRIGKGAALPNVVEMLSHGGPLEIARVVLETKGKARVLRRAACMDSGQVEQVVEHAKLENAIFGPGKYLVLMQQALEKMPASRLKSYRSFFFDLDRRTEPILLANDQLRSPSPAETRRTLRALRFVRRALAVRTSDRMAEHMSAPHRCTPFRDPLLFRPHVETISTIFLSALHRHFRDSQGRLDFAQVEEAFEMFSTGALRYHNEELDLCTTQPSSGTYFLFGEFAMLSVECGVEPDWWTRLANVMVRTQDLYCRVYPPEKKRPRLADYRAANFSPLHIPTPSECQALRASYAGSSLSDLARSAMHNLHLHAPAEFDAVTPSAPGGSPPPTLLTKVIIPRKGARPKAGRQVGRSARHKA